MPGTFSSSRFSLFHRFSLVASLLFAWTALGHEPSIPWNEFQDGISFAERERYPEADPSDLVGGEAANEVGEECAIVITSLQDYPRLALNTGGPIGVVRALAFSPDGTRLYSAGKDKAVQGWELRATGRSIRRTASNQAVLAQTLRWEIARGLRGTINAIAASPVDRKLAIGGYSARDSSGDIVLYDTARGQVLRALQGHLSPVISLDFSPDGSRLISVDRTGEVRAWSAADPWSARVLAESFEKLGSEQFARFLDNEHVVVSQPPAVGAPNGRLAIFKTEENSPPTFLPPAAQGAVTAIEVSKSGTLASSDVAGNIHVWTKTGDDWQARNLRKGRTALWLAFGPEEKLFVATKLEPAERGGKQAVLEMWDVKEGTLLDQVQTATEEHNFVCAVSPDGSRVVTYGGDRNELYIFLLKDREGKDIPKPFSKGVLALRGTGRKIWKVAFAADGGNRIGFSTKRRAPIEESFDPSRPGNPAEPANKIPWRDGKADAGNWSIRVPTKGDEGTLLLFEGDQPRGTIALDPVSQGSPRAICWLPGRNGAPYGVAIGTDLQDGIFIYGVREKDRCPLLRYYRDHGGTVTSLAVSADGKFLASGSLDQTIKIWSLEGLTAPPGAFSAAPAWGGTFEIRDGNVVLTSLLEAGTAARKGLRVGDKIVEATFAARVGKQILGDEQDHAQPFTTTKGDEILAGLVQSPLTENTLLTVDRRGRRLNQRILLVPAWDPLMSLLVDERGEWALWTPQGYYDASVNGDEMFGWLINRGPDRRPDFHRADQFRLEFERPGVLRGILDAGSVPAALRADAGPKLADPNVVLGETARKTPAITILSPLDGENLDAARVKIRARVAYPDPDLATTVNGAAFVNGVKGKVVDERSVANERTYEWDIAVADIYNRVRVVAEAEDPNRVVSFADAHFRVREVDDRRPSIHLVTLAASQYEMVTPLRFSVADAEALADQIRKRTGNFYELGTVIPLQDEQITRENLANTFVRLKTALENAKGNDLLVVFLAGHGVAIDGEYYFVPTACSADFDEIKEKGIAWAQLRSLASLPCRKLFLLDTCHSGSVVPLADNPGQWKQAIRPLAREQILVLSATDVGQAALEFGSHGLFTQCLLDGFAGPADTSPRDGSIFLEEIVRYVETEVPARTDKLSAERSRRIRQTPRSSPSDLLAIVPIPLVTTDDASAGHDP